MAIAQVHSTNWEGEQRDPKPTLSQMGMANVVKGVAKPIYSSHDVAQGTKTSYPQDTTGV